MTTKQRNSLLAAAAVGVALLVWFATRTEPVAVSLMEATRGTVEATVANTRAGTVDACQRARMSPATGGQIARLTVSEGDTVSEGQVLLELWNEDLEAGVVLAEAEIVAATARVEEACTTADVSRRNAERLLELNRKGIASEENTDKAVGDAKAHRAACDAATASRAVSAARLEVAMANLERTRLRAPFTGVIAEVNGELGEFVTPSPVGVPTPPTVDLIETGCLYVSAPIDEVDAAGIRTEMSVRITLDAFADRVFAGTVRRVAPYILDVEKQARTVDVEVDFVDPAEMDELLVGYSADVEIVLATRDDVLHVPTEAVLEGRRLFVYDADAELLEQREVEVGVSNWQHSEITAGLDDGELVVLSVDREGVADGAHAVPDMSSDGDGSDE